MKFIGTLGAIAAGLIRMSLQARAADDVAWGQPDNGLRMGIALDQAKTPSILRVMIQNSSTTARTVLVNDKCNTRMYRFGIDARSPEGKLYPLVDEVYKNLPLLGISCPVYARIEPGATHELKVELMFFAIESPKPSQPTSPDELLKAGYSLKVSGDFPGEPNSGVRWELVSGELHPPAALPDDKIAWGLPDAGMRMGIALDQSAAERTLRVFVQNTMATARNIMAVLQCNTKIYPLELTATSPEGKSIRIVDRNVPAGIIGPDCSEYARVDPGTNYEFRLGLADLINDGYPQASQPGLDSFLEAGYSLHVSADLQGDPYSGIHWNMASGELRL